MAYKVVPFHPTILDKGGSAQAAKELQTVIDREGLEGWKFQSLETVTTTISPTGCASLFGKNEAGNFQIVVFVK